MYKELFRYNIISGGSHYLRVPWWLYLAKTSKYKVFGGHTSQPATEAQDETLRQERRSLKLHPKKTTKWLCFCLFLSPYNALGSEVLWGAEFSKGLNIVSIHPLRKGVISRNVRHVYIAGCSAAHRVVSKPSLTFYPLISTRCSERARACSLDYEIVWK